MKIYNKNELDLLANILKNDGVISVPTDTVYGLCTQIYSTTAFEKLKHIKKRPSDKTFPVMCATKEQMKQIAIIEEREEKLIDHFMPGPITLVLNKKSSVLQYVNNKGTSITTEFALRIAPTKELRSLISKVGSPIFMTSANENGKPSCQSIEEIIKTFPNLDGILEGNVSYGEASTIVDCTSNKIKIQRQGPISEEQIMKILK